MDGDSSPDTLQVLAQASLFRGLQTPELEAGLEIAHRRRVKRKTFFFHQEEQANMFYVLLEGRVRLSQLTPEGHQVIMRFMGPGDSIGIIVALSNTTYPVSAEAVTDCLALAWDEKTIVHLMERYPRLAVNGMRLVANRFHELQNRYRELATERVEQRVARALLRLARQAGKRTEDGILLDLPLTRQDLAEMTGTTLYTVSRICSKWEQVGLIDAGRGRITICSPHDLVTIAEDLPSSSPLE
jgi:CRP-like cAMP-binding protein